MAVKAVADEELSVSGHRGIIGVIINFQRVCMKEMLTQEEVPSWDESHGVGHHLSAL